MRFTLAALITGITGTAVAACKSDPDMMMPMIDAMDPGLIDVPDSRVGDGGWHNNANWLASDGPPDLVCATWTLIDTATPEDPVIVDGDLQLLTSAAAEQLYYKQEGGELVAPTLLVITARTRLYSNVATSSVSASSISFALNGKANTLHIDETEIFLLQNASTKGPAYAAMTNDAFHDYRIEMQLASGAIAVSYDGAEVLTGSAYSTTEVDAITWGESAAAAYGESRWLSFSHNAHVPTPCP